MSRKCAIAPPLAESSRPAGGAARRGGRCARGCCSRRRRAARRQTSPRALPRSRRKALRLQSNDQSSDPSSTGGRPDGRRRCCACGSRAAPLRLPSDAQPRPSGEMSPGEAGGGWVWGGYNEEPERIQPRSGRAAAETTSELQRLVESNGGEQTARRAVGRRTAPEVCTEDTLGAWPRHPGERGARGSTGRREGLPPLNPAGETRS